uniref:Uncharacterized protein n=1 Tax=Globisporangium ultimum (strain ATCC 200006 / CBS 805.95 / DAOM BR144) TaxID=431595 RepID=K3WP50_GLOUD
MDTHAAFLETIHMQCWTRLTDDTRLAFYHDLTLQATHHFENEQLKVRMQAAVNFWRLLEPRSRMNRWKRFVANVKLCKRGNAQFRACSSRKLVRALRSQRLRRQQMREWATIARVQHHWTLSHWIFRAWTVFTLSLRQVHHAAWQRGIRHNERVRTRRAWRRLAKYYEVDEKAHKAARQEALDAFVAKRYRNMLRASMTDWHYYYRRRKEVVDAQVREQALHRNLHEQARNTTECTQMALEDACSEAVEAQARELAERGRQRAFQDATQHVYAQRKLKQQEDARTQYKKGRRAQVLAQMDTTWQHIAEKLRVDVRSTTLAWFATPEGKAVYQVEGTRIFDLDPVVMQKAMVQHGDNHEFALPQGCRWKLQLEDYGGRFAKPFYLNTETFEKLVCDEIVLDNCEEIAKEVLIQQRVDAALRELNAKVVAVARDKLEHDAALSIQGLFRCRHALLVTRSVIRAMFVKCIDPSSGGQVYFNIRRVETWRKPPKLIGSDEPLIPVESTTWVRRVDDDSNTYYIRIDTPPSAPDGMQHSSSSAAPLWSWTPPEHFIMCMQCRMNFATRRCNESGARFCIMCYADNERKRRLLCSQEDNSVLLTWTKLPVQPAKCIVCRNALADVVCHDCHGDATCSRCFDAVHRNHPTRKTHTNRDFLKSVVGQ